MIVGTLNNIREERAARIRDVEYLREISADDAIEDRLFDLELRTMKESGNIFAECVAIDNELSGDDSFKHDEIQRILNADHDISFDEMLGLSDDE